MTWADRSKPGRIRHGPAELTGHRIGTRSFFLDVLETQRGRTLAAGAERWLSGEGSAVGGGGPAMRRRWSGEAAAVFWVHAPASGLHAEASRAVAGVPCGLRVPLAMATAAGSYRIKEYIVR
jgi:hypothetical protein